MRRLAFTTQKGLRSAGTTGEKILRAAALSFMRGLEVGRSARMADDADTKKQPA